MQKLFDALVDYPLVRVAANEEFPDGQAVKTAAAENAKEHARGWNAYEIWHKRIRLLPGVRSLFLPRI